MHKENKTSIKIGCCGFTQARKKYFEVFSAIEIQQTFYQLPRVKTVQRWREQAPNGFEFTLKAWQLITHKSTSPTYRRLRENIPEEVKSHYGSFQPTSEVFEACRRTLEIASILEAKVIVFQCPASFEPTQANKKNMREFFSTVARDRLIFCWEPRGTWKNDEIRDICQELNLVHCVDPFRHEVMYGSIQYYRLHGIGGYKYRYTDSDLKKLSQKCSDHVTTYTMFNNISMQEDAQRFQALFEKKRERRIKRVTDHGIYYVKHNNHHAKPPRTQRM